MTVSIKIDDSKKQKLDRFLSQLLLREGKKVTLQEAVGLILINYALENENTFIQYFKEVPSLEEDPAWKMFENPKHWGEKDASERIDECLCGS